MAASRVLRVLPAARMAGWCARLDRAISVFSKVLAVWSSSTRASNAAWDLLWSASACSWLQTKSTSPASTHRAKVSTSALMWALRPAPRK